VTAKTPAKLGAWMLGDIVAGSCPGCVTGDNPNWCGPQIRHGEKSNVAVCGWSHRNDEGKLVLRKYAVARSGARWTLIAINTSTN